MKRETRLYTRQQGEKRERGGGRNVRGSSEDVGKGRERGRYERRDERRDEGKERSREQKYSSMEFKKIKPPSNSNIMRGGSFEKSNKSGEFHHKNRALLPGIASNAKRAPSNSQTKQQKTMTNVLQRQTHQTFSDSSYLSEEYLSILNRPGEVKNQGIQTDPNIADLAYLTTTEERKTKERPESNDKRTKKIFFKKRTKLEPVRRPSSDLDTSTFEQDPQNISLSYSRNVKIQMQNFNDYYLVKRFSASRRASNNQFLSKLSSQIGSRESSPATARKRVRFSPDRKTESQSVNEELPSLIKNKMGPVEKSLVRIAQKEAVNQLVNCIDFS